jgi:aspartyl-tRNA(Asn)/glutamyl-tRNA(Gln) amidotransferase subunit C
MVTKTEVEKVATLAKLEFAEEELDALTMELNSVLGYIDQLKELDVSNVAPLENLNDSVEASTLRKDETRECLTVEEALRNAPKSADGYFLVPKVLAQEASPTIRAKTYGEQEMVGDEGEEL